MGQGYGTCVTGFGKLKVGRVLIAFIKQRKWLVALGVLALLVWVSYAWNTKDDVRYTITETGPMVQPRTGHDAFRLSDGRVVILGGYGSGGKAPINSVEIYSPNTNEFTGLPKIQWNRLYDKELSNFMEGRGFNRELLLPDDSLLITYSMDKNFLGRKTLVVSRYWPLTGKIKLVKLIHYYVDPKEKFPDTLKLSLKSMFIPLEKNNVLLLLYYKNTVENNKQYEAYIISEMSSKVIPVKLKEGIKWPTSDFTIRLAPIFTKWGVALIPTDGSYDSTGIFFNYSNKSFEKISELNFNVFFEKPILNIEKLGEYYIAFENKINEITEFDPPTSKSPSGKALVFQSKNTFEPVEVNLPYGNYVDLNEKIGFVYRHPNSMPNEGMSYTEFAFFRKKNNLEINSFHRIRGFLDKAIRIDNCSVLFTSVSEPFIKTRNPVLIRMKGC